MRTVSKIFLATCISIIFLSVVSCHKVPKEEALQISTDASSVNTTPSPNFNLNLKVESKMPSGGVSIEYNVKGETDNHVIFSKPGNSKQFANQAYAIQFAPANNVYMHNCGDIENQSDEYSNNKF
jgi:hypothetical protein